MTTPHSNSGQTRNRAGGYAYEVDPWTSLDRFLLLGSEAGDYYSTPEDLTVQNTTRLRVCLALDGARFLERVVAFREQGRSLRPRSCIFAFALALKAGDLETRRLAAEFTPRVCSTASQLFSLATCLQSLGGGWGRVTKRAFSNWYLTQTPERLSYQLLKYRKREGWTHRDLLRKCHPRAQDPERTRLLGWPIHGWSALDARSPEQHARSGGAHAQLAGFVMLQSASEASAASDLIRAYALPWEAVPTPLLRDVDVCAALLEKMPMQAMLRNLARLSANGLLSEGSPASAEVSRRLRDAERLRAARLHPMHILNALRIYASGRGLRGSLTWHPVERIKAALQEAFYLAFESVEPTNARILLAIDVSGSMAASHCAGLEGLSPREVSVALAMGLARSEERYSLMGFSHHLVPLSIGRSTSLEAAVDMVSNVPFGRTDCALPMLHALKARQDYDLFVVITDNETWCGSVHPVDALRRYRQERVPDARLMVCACTASPFSIADPKDAGTLDVCGADANLPRLMREFLRSTGYDVV